MIQEITARFIFTHLKNNNLSLDRAIKQNSEVQYMLSGQRDCAHCGCGFLNMWLECVQFVAVKQVILFTKSCKGGLSVQIFLGSTAENFLSPSLMIMLCTYR